MKPKTIWMMLLVTGTLSSCTKGHVDKVYLNEYFYINNSDYIIEVTNSNEEVSFTIGVDKTLTIAKDLFHGDSDIITSDTSIVTFNSLRQVKFTHDDVSEYNIKDLNNYDKTKKGDNHVQYTYIFTEKDFENATLIEE